MELDRPIAEIQAILRGLDWDYPVAMVKLTRDHIRNILESVKAGTIETAGIEDWANCVEGRDDIGFPDATTKEALHILAKRPHLSQCEHCQDERTSRKPAMRSQLGHKATLLALSLN